MIQKKGDIMKKSFVALPLLLIPFLIGCGGGETPPSHSQTGNSSTSSSIVLSEFVNARFDSSTITFDGNAHILPEVQGVPEGTQIQYVGREDKTNVGQYKATATLVKEGFKTKSLEATLTILPANFVGLTYEDVTVPYDGANHINDVKLIGVLPTGTTTTQKVTDNKGETVTKAVEAGTYHYSIVVQNPNFKEVTLEATLCIRVAKKDMPVHIGKDGTVYFANGLHHSYLYSWKDSKLSLLDYSSPKEFKDRNKAEPLFISRTPFLNSAKKLGQEEIKTLCTATKIDDVVTDDKGVLYFSSSSLSSDRCGIYRVENSSSAEPVITNLFEGKAGTLGWYNGSLYFENVEDKGYLYSLNVSTLKTSLVLKEKTHEFFVEGNYIYATVNGLLNDYIARINLSTLQPDKLTNNAGEYLTKKGNALYYNYIDLTGKIDANKQGIWKVDLTSKESAQIYKAPNINGFDVVDSSRLIYIDSTDYRLYSLDIASGRSQDLLAGFVAPEAIPMNIGGKTATYGDDVYYLDMHEGKTLYRYSETTGQLTQITSNKVQDFTIWGDYLYFNSVSSLTNNDIYRANLKVGSEAVKISSNDIRNMTCDGSYIYGTHYNFAGLAGGIARMKIDGSEYVKFSEINGAKNFIVQDKKLYFINAGSAQDNGSIEWIALNDIRPDSTKLVSTSLGKEIKNVKQFMLDGDNLFYLYNGIVDNSVRRSSLSLPKEGVAIASSKTNPSEMILQGDTIYYYSFAASSASDAGFYKVNKNASGDKTQKRILDYNQTYYATSFAISRSNNLYFLNYIPKLRMGDAHTYRLNLLTNSVSKIN